MAEITPLPIPRMISTAVADSASLMDQGMESSMIWRTGLRSWIEAPRGRHSEKPEVVRALIERASPGPRLELFARRLTPGWFAWGHEVAEPLAVQHVSTRVSVGIEGTPTSANAEDIGH